MKQRNKIIGILGAVTMLVFGVGIITYAADSYEIKSQGKIIFNNDTEETADDVVFDATDLVTLNNMVESGKSNLSSVLNTYPNTQVEAIDTFENLTMAVDNLTSVPDIYYFDKATEGPDCVRCMLIDGSYYPCDQYGNKTSETALSGTITVVTKDDTTEPAEGEIQLVKYEQIGAENLSAGFAGYADKTFILGSGSDNISYRNQGAVNSKVGTATASQVLEGKTFTNSSGVGVSGTMPNKGAWKNTPTASTKVTIPEGYHNGSGYVDTSSVYTNGYNAGVAAADTRVNTASASYTQGYNDGKTAGTTTILNSFSGQELKHPSNNVAWNTTPRYVSGYTQVEQYKWIYNTLTVAQISSPQYFSALRIDYMADNGMQVDGVWHSYNFSASFELKGDSGTTYYTGDGLSSINITSITEPVTLYVTWGVKHNDSSETSHFKVNNIFATIK